uniref:Uncharacterized protein n=1 Tax=Rhizophora mucronata TaxID=61149 RepID=A0A2P2M8A2_RHIMU
MHQCNLTLLLHLIARGLILFEVVQNLPVCNHYVNISLANVSFNAMRLINGSFVM